MTTALFRPGVTLTVVQHSRRYASRAFDFPVVESVTAKLPMYCEPSAKTRYTSEADMDFTKSGKDYWKFLTSRRSVMDMLHMYWHSKVQSLPVHDARALEAAEGLSKRDFFHKHGFVLLDHRTSMSAEDWLASEYKPLKAHNAGLGTAHLDFTKGETPVDLKYNKEINALMKTVLPSATDIMAPVRGIQRGPGSAYENVYASVVHTDFPVDYDSFRESNTWLGCSDHIEHFEATAAASYFVINLWRPILPMKGPVKSTPLAMLHPMTVDYQDFVTVDLIGGQFPDGQSYLHVRYHPDHRWFYYPDITTDEVLVWKQAHFVKGERVSRMPVPHTAFKHPNATETEPRCSFEHRVAVFCNTSDGL